MIVPPTDAEVNCNAINAFLWVWAEPESAPLSVSVEMPNESKASIVASNDADICSLLVWAEELNAEVLATYSALNADALELLKAVCVADGNLAPIVVAKEADKLASSPNAAANSSSVSKAPGAALTKAFTFALVYVWIELLNVEYPVVCVMFTCADPP